MALVIRNITAKAALLIAIARVNPKYHIAQNQKSAIAHASQNWFAAEPKVKYCCKPHAECPKICLSDIAGLDNCIEESLRDFATMIKHYKRFQTHGARVPRFVLLTAPAGMQLPRLVEAIAGEACIPFYHVPCRAARKGACIKGTIKAAQEAHKPAIVLIEDVDDHDNAIAKDCVIDFEELICHKTPIIIIATAKCIHKVPLSLLLPGRFDIRIEFPLPSEANREEILRALLKGKPRHKALDIAQIAKDTEDYSPVDLWALVNQALLCAAARFSEVLAEGDFECAKAIISVGEQPPCCPRHHPCPEQPGCPHGGSAVTQ
jgi:cell division protease FtsH